MATALGPNFSPNVHLNGYPQQFSFTELDFQDNRYQQPLPPNSPPITNNHAPTTAASPSYPARDDSLMSRDTPRSPANSLPSANLPPGWQNGTVENGWNHADTYASDGNPNTQQQQQQQQQQPLPQRNDYQSAYPLPPGAAPRIIDRYSMDDTFQRVPSSPSSPRQATIEPGTPKQLSARPNTAPQLGQIPQPSQRSPDTEQASSSTPRNPPTPSQPTGPGSSSTSSGSPAMSPATPLPASPNYMPSIPISQKPRAYAQQPTYITPPTAPNPLNPIYSPAPLEEICVECAMRDQDMADVDVTTLGIWERDSDILYEDLLRREREDKLSGIVPDPSRPRATGGRLTEPNLKIWLSVNPREPASRQQTLEKYIRSQRRLLEAEAMAYSRALQEAQHLDNRMRDAYAQLRRSAYDTGSFASPIDDLAGVRIKPPRSATSPVGPHARSHSRDVTLLENGMIVEHVDVRKEEREARDRKRKEDRRARKSSRSSAVDVTSLYSVQSLTPYAESGAGLRPYSRYSGASSPRPSSVLTNPMDRPNIPHAYSQASFSDVHSMGSASPRRARFFGMKNLSTGWRSQDSLAQSGMSGSMIDMHVALQREAAHTRNVGQGRPDADALAARHSQLWPTNDLQLTRQYTPSAEKPKKKPGGLKKIWRIVTGSGKPDSNASNGSRPLTAERHDDDSPLAPPPPLSYLVDRSPVSAGDLNGRHASTPSLTSPSSGKNGFSSSPGMSPPTAPSSNLPSPASSGADREVVIEGRKVVLGGGIGQPENQEDVGIKSDENDKNPLLGNVYPAISEPAMKQRVQSSPSLLSNQGGMMARPPPLQPSRRDSVITREKSLPPLPDELGGWEPQQNGLVTDRPRTVYTYDPRQVPLNAAVAHHLRQPQPGFRSSEGRRQSFGGITSRPSLPPGALEVGGPMYDEFGFPRATNPMQLQRPPLLSQSVGPGAKRKSRFGIASLFGKKQSSLNEPLQDTLPGQGVGAGAMQHYDLVTLRNSGSVTIGQDELMHATMPPQVDAGGQRMSIMSSRRALEELVEQDPDFVAYRYPSNDQRLDLLQ